MLDFMKQIMGNTIPLPKLLASVANEIIKQTGKPCDKFDILYKVYANDLSFIVYDGPRRTVHGYEDKSIIGNFIKTAALTKLDKTEVLDYVLIHWERNAVQKPAEIYYTSNGAQLVTTFDI